jgi:hypothetical protein
MLDATANQFYLSTMILPVSGVPGFGVNYKTTHTPFNDPLLAEWYKIVDPKKKYEFEKKHPEVLNRFGLYQDPRLYTENQAAFYKMNQATALRDKQRIAALAEAKRTGDAKTFMDVYTKTGADFATVMDALKKQYPDWSKTLNADPILSAQGELTKAFPNISKQAVAQDAPSKDVVQLGKQVNYFKRLSTDQSLTAAQRDDAKNLYFDALSQLSHLRSFPKNAAEATYVKVRKIRDAYTTWSNAQYTAAKNLTGWHSELFQAGYMLEREQKNEPVMVDGLKFPGPATQAFWHYDKTQRDQKLTLWASDNWGHLAGYEKRLMGVNAPYDVTEGWYFLNSIVASAHKQGASVTRDQKKYLASLIDKGDPAQKIQPHPGFYRDYAFSLQPKIARYEVTKAYKDMPANAKALYERLLAGPAKKLLASGAKPKEIHLAWTDYIDQLKPQLPKYYPALWHIVATDGSGVWPAHLLYTLTNS